MSEYRDKQGNDITAEEWTALFTDMDYRYISQTTLPNGITVSTVWLGYTFNYGGNGPTIFETMVFMNDDSNTTATYRYSTLEEAETGHRQQVWTHSDGDLPEESRWSQICNEEDF